ncbi:MAG: gliding motility-associated C-terminal domain-containing protein [Bacteroidota bacterium]
MKQIQITLLFLSLCTILATAQAPSNDECSSAIDLGTAPICQPEVAYTNIDATTSYLTNPTCFQGVQSNRDVWFSFTTNEAIELYTITIQGFATGPNSQRIGNPQVALYRGSCSGLGELFCGSAENGTDQVELDSIPLFANTTYILRVNDFSAGSLPNAGDFSVCVEEYVPAIRMGETSNSSACSGTVFDSGGEEGTYGNNENLTFTICPEVPSTCINLKAINYDIEKGFDVLSIYEGNSNQAPLLARLSDANFGTPFNIQAESECVTLEFISDGNTRRSGFEIEWECSNTCAPTSLDQITEISTLPFSGSFSSCDVPATFASTACGTDAFLNGPEKIFTFTPPSTFCAKIEISETEDDAGIIILDGLPDDPDALCIAESGLGFIKSVELTEGTTYYIVVAQPNGCVNFDINIEETECLNPPTLLNSLCNPLNGCDEGTPGVLTFEDGFQDFEFRFIGIPIFRPSNSGCWLGAGLEPDYVWFTVEAQADGKFGFILQSADNPTDIDFNVWGPFSQEDVCSNKNRVIRIIENSNPIRSSFSDLNTPTGLADFNPITEELVEDEFDCGNIIFNQGAGGDGLVRTIDVREGEVYLVLVNDFGNQIENNRILVDWSPSDPEVLQRLPITVESEDEEICRGESVQLSLTEGIENITWSPAGSLSCSNCPNPVATPEKTTTYKATVEGFCTIDEVEITVSVVGLNELEDVTICAGEEFQVNAGTELESATYRWTAPRNVSLSCTDCPNPVMTASARGNYNIRVDLISEECSTTERFRLSVLSQAAPDFDVIDDVQICEDEVPLNLGADTNSDEFQYNWSSVPAGFTSNEPNPSVSPTETTTYFVDVSSPSCPLTSMDSVTVEVFKKPLVEFLDAPTEAICQGDEIFLTESESEEDVIYRWVGPSGSFSNDTLLNTRIFPQQTGTYRFTATRGACEINETFDLTVTPIGINVLSTIGDAVREDLDTARLCLGDEIIFNADPSSTRPNGVTIDWSPKDGSLSDTVGMMVTAQPTTFTDYIATVENMGCIVMDTVTVIVDSLPLDALPIMPQDTMICEGNYVLMTSSTYEPFLYPDIDFMWTPATGQQTPDSLYNMVVTPDTTTTYFRETTNGACSALDSTTIVVNPLPEVEIRPQNPAICSGESVNLEVVLLNPEEVTIESYMWEPMEGLSCMDCENPTAFMPGGYTVMVMSDKMCPGSASVNIAAIESPIIQIANDQTICEGESIQLNLGASADATYTWESNDASFEDTDNPTPTVTPPVGTFTYTVIAENDQCPPEMASVTIMVVSAEAAALDLDASVEAGCLGDEVTVTANVSGSGGTFEWENTGERDENVTTSSINVVLVDSSNIVAVTFTDANECFEVSREIEISASSSEVGVPNAFIPGSNNNGEFRLFYANADLIDFQVMQIFDRWGNLVFETEQIGVGWNGKRNNDGADLPSDTYAYRIVYNETCGEMEEITLNGKVLLIR